jgi:hypothetical protein
VLPSDTQGRRILAAHRHEILRNGPPAPAPAGAVRRRLAGVLHAAAARLAPAEYAARQPRVSR